MWRAGHSEEEDSGRDARDSLSKPLKTLRFRGSSPASSRSVEQDRESKLADDEVAVEDRLTTSKKGAPSDEIHAGLEDQSETSHRESSSVSQLASLSPDSMRLPSSRDARDRLFGGFLTEEEEEEEDDDAEIVIERDGRVRVHPHSHYGGFNFGRRFHRSGPSFLVASERRLREEQSEMSDLALLRELRRERQDRDIHLHMSERERALQEEIHRIFLEEEAKFPLHEYRSNRPFSAAETMARVTSSPGSSLTSGSSLISSSIGYVIAFILGFGSILLIASLCCVLRAVYVRRKKEAMKKLLREKLGPDAGFDDEPAPPAEVPVKDVPGAEEGWVDIQVEQQSAPAEEMMMDVARQTSIQRSASEVAPPPIPVPVEPEKPAKPNKSLKKKKDRSEAGSSMLDASGVPAPPSAKKADKADKKKGKKKKDDLKKALSSKHRGGSTG
ncbi:hypothetical protein BESB_063180 [Besnoitia besnoiti]|uniref:Transmembrane protein n=1 Tax=Besnoitia besnoiti TaxID=94643 RepID=A0A2A9MGP5_BESBE|nr:hypothetical protein BESB_063180 [Besnoitia besnoiti]PFH35431.1 hypothetical protein BESB_063180 [Besnoitia besnoiti]